jgi:hypothetical protein
MARAANFELAALRERFSVGVSSATATAAATCTACGTGSTGRARATCFACCTAAPRTTVVATRTTAARTHVIVTAGTPDVAAARSTRVAAGRTRSTIPRASATRTAPVHLVLVPAEVTATHAIVIVGAAISVIVPTTALIAVVAARICARSTLGSFVGYFVDVFVVIDAGIAARAAHLTLTTTQTRRIAGSVDGITRRTAATSCKSNQTTAGEQEPAHVLGFHVHPPSGIGITSSGLDVQFSVQPSAAQSRTDKNRSANKSTSTDKNVSSIRGDPYGPSNTCKATTIAAG